MSPDEQKMKRGVVAELRTLLKKMDVDSLDDAMRPQGEMELEIITPSEGTDSLDKALPHPSTALNLEAIEEGSCGAEPKYPPSGALMSNQDKEDRGISKKKDKEDK